MIPAFPLQLQYATGEGGFCQGKWEVGEKGEGKRKKEKELSTKRAVRNRDGVKRVIHEDTRRTTKGHQGVGGGLRGGCHGVGKRV